MLTIFRQLLDLIGRARRGRWLLLLALAVVASLIEMVGAGLIYVLLGLFADPGQEVGLPFIGDLRRLTPGLTDTGFLTATALAIGAFFVFRAGAQVVISYVMFRIAHNAGAVIASRLMRGYLDLPYAFHLRRNSSELVRNAHIVTNQVTQQGLLQLVFVVADSVLIAGMMVVMLVVAPAATGIAVVIVGAAAFILLRVIQPRLKRLGSLVQQLEKRTLAVIQQSLHGIRDVKLLGVQTSFASEYRRGRLGKARAQYMYGTATQLPRNIIETALFLFIIALFVASLASGTTTEELLATVGLFAYVGLRLMPSVQRLVAGLNSLRYASAAIADVHADLLRVSTVAPYRGDRDRISFEHLLETQGVSFTYEGTATPALEDVALTIRPGEVIGICGPTGGGKTTLTDLLTGLLEPTQGRVLIDGTELRGHEADWHLHLGIVPQMVFLLDDTFRRNIALGVPDGDIDEQRLKEAVQLAQLETFVASLPTGLDTEVGERGVRVSGGQRQRIAIARALYRRPEVLFFDEGTSALDNATEATLMASLEELRGSNTIVLVAHRLSTVRNCDRIFYLEHGRIAASGTYEELQRNSPGFRSLATSG
jgi:ATP-binding cassette, subfamily B, bacterial PglK